VSPPPGIVPSGLRLERYPAQKVCDTLAPIAVSAPNAIIAITRHLRYVEHNAAIPCVAKVLEATDSLDSSMFASWTNRLAKHVR
jgi:hypothetical protein